MDRKPAAGQEILRHTVCCHDGQFRTTLFLSEQIEGHGGVRVFKGQGSSATQSEKAARDQATEELTRPKGMTPSHPPARRAEVVAGYQMDIICDAVGKGRYRAYPFFRDQDGSLDLLLHFHVTEAVTANTPDAAMARCIERLEEFLSEPRTGAPRSLR